MANGRGNERSGNERFDSSSLEGSEFPVPDRPIEQAVFDALENRTPQEEQLADTPWRDPGLRINLSESMAERLVDLNVEFRERLDVTVHAQGTDLDLDLDDLSELGVDHVVADDDGPGDGDVLLALGLDLEPGTDPTQELLDLLESFDARGRPLFENDANVGLTMTEEEEAAFDAAPPEVQQAIATQLVALGIDYVQVIEDDDTTA